MSVLPLLEGMIIILLSIVGGLVLWLHFRLSTLSRMLDQEEHLARQLEMHLSDARRGLDKFAELAKTDGATLEAKLKQGRDMTQDLDFMLHRADKLVAKMEGSITRSQQEIAETFDVSSSANVRQNVSAISDIAAVSTQVEHKTPERSVLLGDNLENTALEVPEKVSEKVTGDVRETFLKAIETRQQRVNQKTPSKTAPKAYGSHAYLQTARRQEKDDLRAVLEGR